MPISYSALSKHSPTNKLVRASDATDFVLSFFLLSGVGEKKKANDLFDAFRRGSLISNILSFVLLSFFSFHSFIPT